MYVSGENGKEILNNQNPQWETLPDLPISLANAAAIAQAGSTGYNHWESF